MTTSSANDQTDPRALLQAALDDSSDKNRNFLIAFLVVELYVLVSILGTTHEQLLLGDSAFSFPFIDVKVPVVGFFILAPLILLAFHCNLLFNLLEHSKKLERWRQIHQQGQSLEYHILHAFMINLLAKYDCDKASERTINYLLLNLIVFVLYSLLPLSILLITLWHFSNYQSFAISLWHFSLVLACLFLHIVYWLRIKHRELLAERYNEFAQLWRSLPEYPFINFYISFIFGLALLRMLALFITLTMPEALIRQVGNAYIPLTDSAFNRFMIPHLELSGTNIFRIDTTTNSVVSRKDEKDIKDEDKDEAKEHFCKNKDSYQEIDLSHRQLRFINLSKGNICNVDFSNTKLIGANFTRTNTLANFNSSNLSFSNLSNSHFHPDSEFLASKLSYSQLDFITANNIDFTLANLSYSSFLNSTLERNQFVQADLSDSEFVRSKLSHSNFMGADFSYTNFLDSELMCVNLVLAKNITEPLNGDDTDAFAIFSNSTIQYCTVDDSTILSNPYIFIDSMCTVRKTSIRTGFFSPEDSSDILESINSTVDNNICTQSNPPTNIELANTLIKITGTTQRKSLDLNNLKLDYIPSELLKLHSLESLSLKNKKLDSNFVSLIAKNLYKIKHLDLNNNSIRKLPHNFSNLKYLKTLKLQSTSLHELPSSIANFRHIETLDISFNKKLKKLPESIGKLKQLKELNLFFTGISHLPKSFVKLSQLHTLNLQLSDIKTIPEDIGKLSELNSLNLRKTHIKIIPDSIGELAKLEKLDLSELDIFYLPKSISSLQNLRWLSLDNTKVPSLPDNIGLLKNLEHLHIGKTDIKVLPHSLAKLQKLTSLVASNTKIAKFPSHIISLKGLKSLYFRGTGISSIPENIENIKQLERLGLSSTAISKLPSSFTRLENLIVLLLDNTSIEELPMDIGQLSKLKQLNIGYTKIKVLPESITKIYSLVQLDLQGTLIEELPENIGDLSNLKQLNISNTKIKRLPRSLASLSKLVKLDVKGLQLIHPPQAIAEQGIEATRAWFHENPSKTEKAPYGS